MKKIKPSDSCEIEPFSDPEILKAIQSVFPAQNGLTLKQEIWLLVRRYGAKEVRNALAKVTTGARKKPADEDFLVWLAVEKYQFQTQGATVESASKELAKKVGANAGKIKNSAGGHGIWVVPDNPQTIRRIHSKIKKQMEEDANLRAALKLQLDGICGDKGILFAPRVDRSILSNLSKKSTTF